MTTTTETPVSCPPSAVHDMTTDVDRQRRLPERRPGDLIVHAGRWDTVTRVSTGKLGNGDDVVHIHVASSWMPCCFPADHLVAVRRYDVDEG